MDKDFLGCIVGGALGDAMGAPFENLIAPRFHPPDELLITDDTQLTLATCESIIEKKAVDPASIAREMANWFKARRITGIGASTMKALTELNVGGHWALCVFMSFLRGPSLFYLLPFTLYHSPILRYPLSLLGI